MEKEQEFLEQYNSDLYEKLSVTVDLLIFTIAENELKVLMIKRDKHPHAGKLSLPGVFVGIKETLDEAANRCLEQKTGLKGIYFEQLYTWGEVKREPRMRIISVSYMALVSLSKLSGDLKEADIFTNLYSVEKLLEEHKTIAFDHKRMIAYGKERIKNKVEYTEVAFELLPDRFTLPQLQRVYEILLGKPLYKANFRKKVKEMVVETGEYTSGEAYRPSRLYKRAEN